MVSGEFVFPPEGPIEGFPYHKYEPYFATNKEVHELSWQVGRKTMELCLKKRWKPVQVCMMTRGGTELGKTLSKLFEIQNMTVFAARSYKPTGDGTTEVKLPNIE